MSLSTTEPRRIEVTRREPLTLPAILSHFDVADRAELLRDCIMENCAAPENVFGE